MYKVSTVPITAAVPLVENLDEVLQDPCNIYGRSLRRLQRELEAGSWNLESSHSATPVELEIAHHGSEPGTVAAIAATVAIQGQPRCFGGLFAASSRTRKHRPNNRACEPDGSLRPLETLALVLCVNV
ncbi:hypothetical protein MTO96_046115, partial [Rhipicephalus appendiculatus]